MSHKRRHRRDHTTPTPTATAEATVVQGNPRPIFRSPVEDWRIACSLFRTYWQIKAVVAAWALTVVLGPFGVISERLAIHLVVWPLMLMTGDMVRRRNANLPFLSVAFGLALACAMVACSVIAASVS